MNGRAWTKADDAAVRRRYPRLGPALGPEMGRTPDAVKRRAVRLGVRYIARPRPRRSRHSEPITEDLVRWAEAKARQYAKRYGDPDDRFGSRTSAALLSAWRSYDPARGVPFEVFCRQSVTRPLDLEKTRGTVAGFRRAGNLPWRGGAPAIGRLEPGDEGRDSGAGPVGWEVEYEDYVVSLARRLPGAEGDVIRAIYLECAGGEAGAARMLGVSHARVAAIHDAAIARLRGMKHTHHHEGGGPC